jgi:hypothetical protein
VAVVSYKIKMCVNVGKFDVILMNRLRRRTAYSEDHVVVLQRRVSVWLLPDDAATLTAVELISS